MSDSDEDGIHYESSTYSSLAFQKMALFREQNQFTDIVLVAGDKKIPAHKVIISSLSDYFNAMFSNDLSEAQQQVVTINNIEADALEALINYAYTAKLEIKVNNVESLLASACMLQVTDVKNACCEFMKSQLHPSNCLGIRAFADDYGCTQLFEIANDYAKENFMDVSKNQEFLLLNVDQIVDILKSDDLNVSSEEEVFHALFLCVNQNPETRKQKLHEVLPAVRLGLLSPHFLVDEVEPAVKFSEKCKDILLETMKFHLLPKRRTETEGVLNHRARKGTVGAIYAVGGNIFSFFLLSFLL